MIPFVPTYHNGYQLIVLWPIRILAGGWFCFSLHYGSAFRFNPFASDRDAYTPRVLKTEKMM